MGKGLYVKYSGIRSWVQRSLIYPISTVDRYFQAASAQDLEFALSVFSLKVVRHRESLHFGVTLWKSAGGLIGGKTRKSRERFTTVAARHFSTTADRECPLIDSGRVWPTDLPRVACVQHLQPAVRLPASLGSTHVAQGTVPGEEHWRHWLRGHMRSPRCAPDAR